MALEPAGWRVESGVLIRLVLNSMFRVGDETRGSTRRLNSLRCAGVNNPRVDTVDLEKYIFPFDSYNAFLATRDPCADPQDAGHGL